MITNLILILILIALLLQLYSQQPRLAGGPEQITKGLLWEALRLDVQLQNFLKLGGVQ